MGGGEPSPLPTSTPALVTAASAVEVAGSVARYGAVGVAPLWRAGGVGPRDSLGTILLTPSKTEALTGRGAEFAAEAGGGIVSGGMLPLGMLPLGMLPLGMLPGRPRGEAA